MANKKPQRTKFDLPPIFKHFEKSELELPIADDLILTVKLPTSLDTAWAMATSLDGTNGISMKFQYAPRIISACLIKINGIALSHKTEDQELKLALNPNIRKRLDEVAHASICQWLYEKIVGRIPYELLKPMYDNIFVPWIDTVGGMVGEKPNSDQSIKEKFNKLENEIDKEKDKDTDNETRIENGDDDGEGKGETEKNQEHTAS